MRLRPGIYNTHYFPSDSGDGAPLNVSCAGITHGNPDFYVAALSTEDNTLTYYQFEYVTEGKGYIEIDGVKHTITAGDFFIIGKGCPRIMCSDKTEPLKKQFVTAKGSIIDGLMRSYKLTDSLYIIKKDVSRYLLNILAILGEAVDFSPEVSAKVTIELLKLIQEAYLYTLDNSRLSPVNECCAENIMKYIDMNIGRKFSIDEMCEAFFVGKTKLRAVFKEKYGISPMEYAQIKRIERAKYYLCNTDIPISNLHEVIGMNDVKYFSKLFKTHTGMTPRQFRNAFYGNLNVTKENARNWDKTVEHRRGSSAHPTTKITSLILPWHDML